MNLFVYVGNDPVNRIDPNGRGWLCDLFGIFCGGGGGGGDAGGGDAGGDGGMCGGLPPQVGNDNGKKCYFTGSSDVGTSAGMRQVDCYYNCPGTGEVKRRASVYTGQSPIDRCTDDDVAPNANPYPPPLPWLPMIPGIPIPVIP